jgi:hypothetical protein
VAVPETAADPEAFSPPKEVIVAPVMVPVALKSAEVRPPAKNPPPWKAKILENAGVEVPIDHTPDVAVIFLAFERL